MFRAIRQILLTLIVVAGFTRAEAFTLGNGALTDWQTVQLGYNLNNPGPGGPVSIGEEYRWNVPTVYYGFSPDFLNYFGQTGVNEIEKGIKFLNDLPTLTSVNIDQYPLTSQRVNHRADALFLVDLKSYALSSMMSDMGLSDPARFVFTLRNRWIGAGGAPTNYHVIKRNFDPITWQHSSYINGQLWTYITIIDNATGANDSIAITEPVDPLASSGLINAPVAAGNTLLLAGGFWTGLTRDDVGGLKYIYRGDNYNVENAPVTAFSTGGGGGPWGIPGGGTNNTFVNQALRSGIGKVQFVRANYDSLFGTFTPVTNIYTDTFITNGATRTQGLQRSLQAVDILFDAADLQGGDATQVIIGSSNLFLAWINNDAVNGVAGQLGPGVISTSVGAVPGFTLVFNSVGPMFFNTWPAFLSEASSSAFFRWGSFDGSTNEPVIYPIGSSIQAAELQALSGGGGAGGGAWAIPPITIITNTATGTGG